MSVFINVYAAESGKIDSDVMLMCAYAAPWSVWNEFARGWEECLAKWNIPYVHMAELMSWGGPYAIRKPEWGDSGRRNLLLDFAHSIDRWLGKPYVRGIGLGLDAKFWRSMGSKQKHRMGKTPDLFMFEQFLGYLLFRVIGMVDEEYRLGLTFDTRSDGAALFKRISNAKAHNPEANLKISSFCLSDHQMHYGLQAADMLAYVCFRGMPAYLSDPLAIASELYGLLTRNTNFGGLILNASLLSEISDAWPLSNIDFVRRRITDLEFTESVKFYGNGLRSD